ncbi:MAG: caspase family protein [Cyanobacteria bacterium J06614_10]
MGTQFKQGYACIIGIGGDLPNTITDAEALADVLKDPERCAYPPEQVQLLTAEAATCDKVTEALETLAKQADENATAIVYFSGHGHQLSNSIVDTYYLLCHGYSTENLKRTALSGSKFTALLQQIPAKKLLVILDCCHAGGLSDLSDFEITKSPLPPEAEKLFSKGKGRILICSSARDELSYGGNPYSAFTYALLKAMYGEGTAKKDGYVRATDLAMYTRQIVPTLTEDQQHPVLEINQADNFVLAYYAGGDPRPKGLPPELARPPQIESTPGELSGNITQTTASGAGSVAIGGSAQGATIITGSHNTVGSYNINQQGKYNINIGSTRKDATINIGDSKMGDQRE